jgi:hypothetical protein
MTQNIKYMLLATLLLTASMISCETNELPAMPLPDGLVIVEGDTVRITSKTDINLDKEKLYHAYGSRMILEGTAEEKYHSPKLPSIPNSKPNVDNLKSSNNKGSLKLFAIGGGTTAGARDFGLFNEGIITSYPHLVARQMGITDFKLPLFPSEEYNGVGRLVPSDGPNYSGGPLQKYRLVTNNGAGKGYDDDIYDVLNSGIQVDKFKGETDVYAGPEFSRSSLRENVQMNSNLNNRFFKGNLESPLENVLLKEFDFIIIEAGMDDILNYFIGGHRTRPIYLKFANEEIGTESDNYQFSKGQNPEYWFISSLMEKNKELKGVLLNIPNPLEFPFLLDADIIFKNPEYTFPSSGIRSFGYPEYLLPTGQIDSILSRKVHYALKPGVNKNMPFDYGTLIYQRNLDDINRFLEASRVMNEIIQKTYNFAIVDIAGLYTKVLSKEGFRTEDGLTISTKEFFSTDGMFPTPLGQALIANEVIRTVNSHYKTNIPPINIREMLAK